MKKMVKLPIFRKTAEYEPITTQGVSLAMYQTQFFLFIDFFYRHAFVGTGLYDPRAFLWRYIGRV